MELLVRSSCVTNGKQSYMNGALSNMFPGCNWRDLGKRTKYKNILAEKLTLLSDYYKTDLLLGSTDRQKTVDDYFENITKAIHDSALEAGCASTKRFKPKSYW